MRQHSPSFVGLCFCLNLSSLTSFFFSRAVKRRPKLNSKYQGRVEKAIEYAKVIESWEDLVDPRTLAFYCLGLDPSPYVLQLIEIEGKKSAAHFSFVFTKIIIDKCLLLAEMMTKFNKDMYARMRGKKDEPLSALGTKSVRITDRGVSILATLLSSPTFAPTRGVSPIPSVEEVPPRNKRLRVGEKQKEKVDSRPSNIWDDAGVSVARAQETFNTNELKVFSRVPADDVARRHLHKLVQVTLWFHSLCAFP